METFYVVKAFKKGEFNDNNWLKACGIASKRM